MTSAGGRKQRLCTAYCRTHQLGGEVPTPLFDFAGNAKIENSKSLRSPKKTEIKIPA